MRITASPFDESSAPDGSSASNRNRSPRSPRDRDPLTFATGELVGVVSCAIRETELFERGHSCEMRLLRREAVELERQRNVLRGGEPARRLKSWNT